MIVWDHAGVSCHVSQTHLNFPLSLCARQAKQLRSIIFILVIAMVVLVGAMAGVVFAVVTLTKDMHVGYRFGF